MLLVVPPSKVVLKIRICGTPDTELLQPTKQTATFMGGPSNMHASKHFPCHYGLSLFRTKIEQHPSPVMLNVSPKSRNRKGLIKGILNESVEWSVEWMVNVLALNPNPNSKP